MDKAGWSESTHPSIISASPLSLRFSIPPLNAIRSRTAFTCVGTASTLPYTFIHLTVLRGVLKGLFFSGMAWTDSFQASAMIAKMTSSREASLPFEITSLSLRIILSLYGRACWRFGHALDEYKTLRWNMLEYIMESKSKGNSKAADIMAMDVEFARLVPRLGSSSGWSPGNR
jgi:hypothetical protein